MIAVSQKYKDTMVAGKRKFNAIITIILEDGTILPDITNANLRTFSIDDAVSDDNRFTMLGSAVINQLVITLDDMYDDYYSYNFYGAQVTVYIDCYLLDDSIERIQKGVFFVEDYRYLDGTIELTCLDFLAKFDKEYSISLLKYPATINEIIWDACFVCGVELSELEHPNQTIDGGTTVITYPPNEGCTFREVLSWIGQALGYFVKCDRFGQLMFKWSDIDVLNNTYGSIDGGVFDDSSIHYASGDIADGGQFNPWNTGYTIASASFSLQGEAHNFYYNYSQEIAVADTTITGVSIIADPPRMAFDTSYIMGIGIVNGDLIYQCVENAPAMFYLDSNDNLIVESDNTTPDEYKFSLNDEGAVICETEQTIELSEEDIKENTEPKTYLNGVEGFVLVIENNDLITTENAQTIVNNLGSKLIGMRFRKAITSHMNDPSIESGDIAVLWDRKNRSHPIIVTHTIFKINGQQRTVCGVESGTRNSAARYSNVSKTYSRLSNELQLEQSYRQQNINALTASLEDLPAMFGTSDFDSFYLHDKKTLPESTVIWRLNKTGISVSTDGGTVWNTGLSLNFERGTAIISQSGICKIIPQYLPNTAGTKYSVMLQKLGQGDLWVSNKTNTYFTVAGTENLNFDWEIKW